MATEKWTREAVESLSYRDRPKVRCAIDRVNTSQDGLRTTTRQRFDAHITLDGNNPWLVAGLASMSLAFRVSWGLLLEVLNDPYAAPIDFLGHQVEYEV